MVASGGWGGFFYLLPPPFCLNRLPERLERRTPTALGPHGPTESAAASMGVILDTSSRQAPTDLDGAWRCFAAHLWQAVRSLKTHGPAS